MHGKLETSHTQIFLDLRFYLQFTDIFSTKGVMSGAFDPTAGGRIHGEYPTDVSLQSPLNINERGVLIPTTPFDSIWNGVAQWFGVTDTNDLNTVLPNRDNFGNTLMTSDDLYGIATTSSPTKSPAPFRPSQH